MTGATAVLVALALNHSDPLLSDTTNVPTPLSVLLSTLRAHQIRHNEQLAEVGGVLCSATKGTLML